MRRFVGRHTFGVRWSVGAYPTFHVGLISPGSFGTKTQNNTGNIAFAGDPCLTLCLGTPSWLTRANNPVATAPGFDLLFFDIHVVEVGGDFEILFLYRCLH